MRAKELAQLILALPEAHQDLEILSREEIWAVSVSPPRLAYIDEKGIEQPDGDPIIALWDSSL